MVAVRLLLLVLVLVLVLVLLGAQEKAEVTRLRRPHIAPFMYFLWCLQVQRFTETMQQCRLQVLFQLLPDKNNFHVITSGRCLQEPFRVSPCCLPQGKPKLAVSPHRIPALAIWRDRLWSDRLGASRDDQASAYFGWHYLSKATCLIRPCLCYALFVVSKSTIIRHILRHFWRKPALDK